MTLASTFAHKGNVLIGGNDRFGDSIASALDWWVAAGVDVTIAEMPRNWLAPPVPRAAIAATPAATAPASLPDGLPALLALLAEGEYLPGAPPPRRRIAPAGDPAAGLMIVSDMPDAADIATDLGPDPAARRLFAGDTAKLFDAMLAAMGLTRETVYLAPLSPARLTGGRIDPATCVALARLMARHVALVKPKAVLLMGDESCKALLGIGRAEARGGLRALNHDGGTVPVMVTPHPRSLRQHPAAKAEAWAAMRALLGVLAQ